MSIISKWKPILETDSGFNYLGEGDYTECKYCGSTAKPDPQQNCRSCGAVRALNKKEERPNYMHSTETMSTMLE